MKTFKSDISDKEFPETDRISGRTIRPMIMDLIRQDSSSFGQESNISLNLIFTEKNTSPSFYSKKSANCLNWKKM